MIPFNPTRNSFINNPTRNQSSPSNYFEVKDAIPPACEWILVQKTGTISFRLGTSDSIVIGSQGCDINIQSPSVEKRHAVLLFDPKSTHFTVKDLNSTNGTYLNEERLQPQSSARLNNMDVLRFGYDIPNSYEHKNGGQTPNYSDGPYSERLGLQRRMSDTPKVPTTSMNGSLETHAPYSPSSSDRFSRHMLQGGRSLNSGSRVTSPSFTLDSGHGSSSTPSSPVKEMSPVPNSVSSTTTTSPLPQAFRSSMDNLLYPPDTTTHSDQLRNGNRKGNNNNSLFCGSEDLNGKIRKDSLEETKRNSGGKVKVSTSSSTSLEFGDSTSQHQPLLVLEESDLSVPNEVFQLGGGLMSSRSPRNSPLPKSNVPEGMMSRSHSFSGEGRSISSLYGTPHWWPVQKDKPSRNIENLSFYSNKARSVSDFGKDECEENGKSLCSEGMEEPGQANSNSSDSLPPKKLSPMAFTVDFGGADDTKKCFGIADSISRFAPRHRRNLSLTKAAEVMGSSSGKDIEEAKTSSTILQKYQRKGSLGTTTAAAEQNSNKNSSVNGLVSPTTSGKYNKEADNSSSSKTKKLVKEGCESSSPSSLNRKDLKQPKPRAAILPTSSSSRRDICNNNKLANPGLARKSEKATESGAMNSNINGAEDTASEAGTYTIKKETEEVKKARHSIDSIFGTDGGGKKLEEDFQGDNDKDISADPASLAWVREWAESAAQLRQTSPNDLAAESETRFFLQETENLVSAMQERVTQKMKTNRSSAQNSDSEEDTYNSRKSRQESRLIQKQQVRNGMDVPQMKRTSQLCREASVLSDSGYALGYASDSSNEGSREIKNTTGGVKYNRAFAIRRGRLVGYDSDGCTTKDRQSLTLPVRGISPRPQVGNVVAASSRPPLPSSPAHLSRNDGGRFSLRVSHKSKTPPNVMTPIATAATIAMGKSDNARVVPNINMRGMAASGTTPVNKSDLTSTKKQTPERVLGSYRKSPSSGENRSNSTLTSKEVEFENWKRRKSYNPMRAAAQGKRKDGTNRSQKNEDDSAEETSQSQQMTKSTSFLARRYVAGNTNGNSEDEDIQYNTVDELESSHSNSPNHLLMSRSVHEDAVSHQSMRSKNKLEALDNLVIATIHSLSVKVRTSSRHLLEKLQVQHCNDENGSLLEEMVSQLKDLEVSNSANSSPTKSSSRELSGTLKNLKKLEQVILVLDRVLCDDNDSEN